MNDYNQRYLDFNYSLIGEGGRCPSYNLKLFGIELFACIHVQVEAIASLLSLDNQQR